MSTESDIVFFLRFSNHNNTNEDLYNKHEHNGYSEKRLIFCFMNVQDVVDTPSNFLEAEHHTIQYPNASLFDEQGLIGLLNSLKKLLVKGVFEGNNPLANNKGNNQETNENKIMNKKQFIRLTENQFHQIVKETVKNVLSEIDKNTKTRPKPNTHSGEKRLARFIDDSQEELRKSYNFNANLDNWWREYLHKDD